jgi:hypothetical protein
LLLLAFSSHNYNTTQGRERRNVIALLPVVRANIPERIVYREAIPIVGRRFNTITVNAALRDSELKSASR